MMQASPRRRGFSLVELFMVFVLIALLAAIAIPRYRDLKRHAIAARVIGDFSAIRVASYNYFAEKGIFPPDASAGIVPAELVTFLPQQFSFTRTQYQLDFDSYEIADPVTATSTTQVVAVTLTSSDPDLVAQVASTLNAGGLALSVGNTFTYVIAGF